MIILTTPVIKVKIKWPLLFKEKTGGFNTKLTQSMVIQKIKIKASADRVLRVSKIVENDEEHLNY